jgi:hypothetical protein
VQCVRGVLRGYEALVDLRLRETLLDFVNFRGFPRSLRARDTLRFLRVLRVRVTLGRGRVRVRVFRRIRMLSFIFLKSTAASGSLSLPAASAASAASAGPASPAGACRRGRVERNGTQMGNQLRLSHPRVRLAGRGSLALDPLDELLFGQGFVTHGITSLRFLLTWIHYPIFHSCKGLFQNVI